MVTESQEVLRENAAAQRRKRRNEQNREDILDAAGDAFATKGYQGATMQDIAARAGFTAAAIYKYFPGKEALFIALLENLMEGPKRAIAAPVDPSTPLEQRLELLVRHLYGVVANKSQVVSYLMSIPKGVAHPTLPGREASHIDDLFLDEFHGWMAEHTTDQERGGCSLEEASSLFTTLTESYLRRWIRRGSQGNPTDLAPLVVRRLVGAMRA